jgi:NADPH-dependent 2,4-dienoyl-CoA reductase/sulfur reductase-like enzyme
MAIVGGGAAGFAAADAIRKLGWQGEIAVFSDEAEQPYDGTLSQRIILRVPSGTIGYYRPAFLG